ncbi:hypothetical protein PQO03_10595 [Lentisphaera profundi]|uniref:Uncharacterized protein n=1 Tax=Lentisphaera profundi TaxID=1658616 RepID=A0ABY7VTK5_9BACT|nr:hypothetical protein [Lentisphaera profundi]WDE96161.1 hypothetical protein PQO03_10595 [Lentisphaera profundi]
MFSIHNFHFSYEPCKALKEYFPQQPKYAWHCRLNTQSLNNSKLTKVMDIWIAGDSNGPNQELLFQAIEIKNQINDYIEESCIFDIQWINNIKLYSFYAGIEEIHDYRQDNEWLSGIYLLDVNEPERCVLTETYAFFNYSTLFLKGKACDKILA